MNKNYKEINELYWIAFEIEKRNKKEATRLYSIIEKLQNG